MRNLFLAIGPLLSAVAVLAGAFGAHGLRSRLDPTALELWETAARYLMYSGLGVTLVGFVAMQSDLRGFQISGWSLLLGAIVFCGTVGALALGGPRWLGAITPIGGLLLIIGFAVFGWTSLKL